jgi:antitoxin Phd
LPRFLASLPRFCCRADQRSLYDYYGHIEDVMRKIQLKDAKANFSAVVDQATRGKPSVITRHGKPEAVVLGFADWERLSRVPSFGRLLMSAPLEVEDLPARSRAPMRDAGL